jgi:tRNA (adenine57-N1/adenine58-N1)-methyltransferase catalytic subunit
LIYGEKKLKVKKDETIVLVDEKNRKYLINTSQKTDKYKGVGVVDPKIFVGKEYGSTFEHGNKKFFIFHPSLMDKQQGLKRRAQIILPKDAAQIIVNCSITPGSKVLEAGIGSAALTITMATMVQPDGKIISYDNREEFIDHAVKNIKTAELQDFVETKFKDVTKGIDETDLDAVIFDIPNPWDAVKHAYKALKPGGYLCCYSPLTTQVQNNVLEIKKHNFIEIKTFENLQREIVVSEKGIRPSFDMLGHTGYLTFARKTK